jgi:hypothetical protein
MGEYFNDPETPGHISLEAARIARGRCRKLVKQGRHPAHERQQQESVRKTERASTLETV